MFFFDKQRDDWQKTDDQPMRGFYTAYPVKSVKRDAKVLATFRHPKARIAGDEPITQELPYLVAMQHGKGKTIYVGSGELWRLRQYNTDFYERLWSALARYAASADPVKLPKPDARGSSITPDQQKAIDKALKWLVLRQHRDGHWRRQRG